MAKLYTTSCWNPYFVNPTNSNQTCEVNTIIVYNDNGEVLLQTRSAWWDESNNHHPDFEVNGDIKRINSNQKEKNLKDKNNFVVLGDCSFEKRYDLYIYYKNVDYKFKQISFNNYFVELEYSVNGFNFGRCVGCVNTKSDSIKFHEVQEVGKKIANCYKMDEIPNLIKQLNKAYKHYQQQVLIDNDRKLHKDYKYFAYNQDTIDMIERNLKESWD